MWNQTVDRALVSGVPEEQIMEVKQKEIGQKAKTSMKQSGRNPALFKRIIITAIYALELLINRILKKAKAGEDTLKARLRQKQQEVKERENNRQRTGGMKKSIVR